MAKKSGSLKELWRSVEALDRERFPQDGLAPILGGGLESHPEFMFIFINPTRANKSSDRGWRGPRYPFIGTKPVWRVFNQAGFLSDGLASKIDTLDSWTPDFAKRVFDFLSKQRLYLTNLVKHTGKTAALPNQESVKLFLPLLEKEIELVKPKYIIAFGTMPFESLTGTRIRLGDYYSEAVRTHSLRLFELCSHGQAKVVPCYFPVGRGNPRKAVEILKLVKAL